MTATIATTSPVAVSRTLTLDERLVELTKTVSASRLGTWQKCRLQFWFRYVLQIQKPKPSSLFVGSVVHLILQSWNKARWRREPLRSPAAKILFDQAWAGLAKEQPVRWDDPEPEEKQSAWRLLEMYFAETPIQPDEKPEAVEVWVEADLSSHGLPKLIGILDLVRAGGRIVDFKTASRSPDTEQLIHLNEVQLTSYALLYRDATSRKESGVELHHLISTKTPKLVITPLEPISDGQLDRLLRVIESYVRGLEHRDFVPSPNSMSCAGCEFYNECRAWSGKEIWNRGPTTP